MNSLRNPSNMTGSVDHHPEQLAWFSEVASAISRHRPNDIAPKTGQGLLSNTTSTRMLVPEYGKQPTTCASGATMYYSQAPRSMPYSGFYQTAYSVPFPVMATIPVNCSQDGRSPYLQVDNHHPSFGLRAASSPSRNPPYQQPVTPTNRFLPQQGRSLLISRSPEENMNLSPRMVDDSSHRKSFDSAMSSSSCSPVIEAMDHSSLRISPSYRVPTGKEGSLKHRILRPPSINIMDPSQQSMVLDAPLSAPPIRTHGEPSPKHMSRSIPSSGYRSLSSSASSINERSNLNNNNHSSLSSESPPPNSPTSLRYPQSFMKGAIIQLANNQLKQVEHMTTEDFLECGSMSSTLKVDTSIVTNIEKSPMAGSVKLGFHVGKDNIQISVEAPLEHPFFVYKQGWSSCSPERSAQRYGLSCHRLKVGDTCISLTDKSANKKKTKETVTNSNVRPKPADTGTKESLLQRRRKRQLSIPDNLYLNEEALIC